MIRSESSGKNRIFSPRSLVPVLAILLTGLQPIRAEGTDRQALLEAALSDNPLYLQTLSRSRQASQTLKTARAAALPDIGFSARAAWLSTPQSYTIQAGDFYNVPPMVLPAEDYTVQLGQNRDYEFSLTLEQPLFTWGRIRNSILAAEAGEEAAGVGREKQKAEIITRLDILLCTLSRLEEMKALLSEQAGTARRLKDLSEESYRNGFLLESDLMSVRLLIRESELARYRAEEQSRQALLSLRTLTGREDLVLEELDLSVLPVPEEYSPEDQEALEIRALAGSFDLRLLELRTRGAARQLEAARGGSPGKPEVGLYLQMAYSGSAFPLIQEDWLSTDTGSIVAALGISTTLYDGGTISGGIGQLEEELTWAELDRQRGSNALKEYIRSSLSRIELSRRNLEYMDLQIQADAAVRKQKEDAWKAGYGEEREVLAREMTWYAHRTGRIQELLNQEILRFQVSNALGRTQESNLR